MRNIIYHSVDFGEKHIRLIVCGAQRRPLFMYMFLIEVIFNLRMDIMLFT